MFRMFLVAVFDCNRGLSDRLGVFFEKEDVVEIQLFLITAHKRSLWQGNVFTPVCHSVPSRWADLPQADTPLGRHPWTDTLPPGQIHPPARHPYLLLRYVSNPGMSE